MSVDNGSGLILKRKAGETFTISHPAGDVTVIIEGPLRTKLRIVAPPEVRISWGDRDKSEGENIKTKLSFDDWMRAVDSILARKLGLTSADLPDCCYADWHENGVTPRNAANRAVRNAKGEEVE